MLNYQSVCCVINYQVGYINVVNHTGAQLLMSNKRLV